MDLAGDLPRAQSEGSYRVEVLERDDERVKVHWVGYSDDKDEWIPADSLTTLDSSHDIYGIERYSPLQVHKSH